MIWNVKYATCWSASASSHLYFMNHRLKQWLLAVLNKILYQFEPFPILSPLFLLFFLLLCYTFYFIFRWVWPLNFLNSYHSTNCVNINPNLHGDGLEWWAIRCRTNSDTYWLHLNLMPRDWTLLKPILRKVVHLWKRIELY